jgi:hypothetical protein
VVSIPLKGERIAIPQEEQKAQHVYGEMYFFPILSMLGPFLFSMYLPVLMWTSVGLGFILLIIELGFPPRKKDLEWYGFLLVFYMVPLFAVWMISITNPADLLVLIFEVLLMSGILISAVLAHCCHTGEICLEDF